ncbi:MAG: M14 metallopeptidase family protein [Vicinamibacterales bacterium]
MPRPASSRTFSIRRTLCLLVVAGVLVGPALAVAQPQAPEQFFGFKIGTDGELARYPKVVEYLEHLSKTSDRVKFEELGKTTMGNPYVLATFSSPANLAKLNRYVEISRRLADPRGLSESEAKALIAEGRPFYFLYATIHSTEVSNGQAITLIAHRLATENSPEIREILDNAIVLLVPSQNPDGQYLVIDHWYKTKGTSFSRVYPDLYHKYVGHDDNRDWFMFTQKETRLNIEKVQNVYKPQITHDMHQQGPTASRIFVPPFQDPYDPNIHPILQQEQAAVGLAMANALVAEGKKGVYWNGMYDLWTPARQYMVYHGQPRILSEIAAGNLADPFVNPAGKDKPLGPQESLMNFPMPYDQGEWHLSQQVDYGVTAAFAGISHVAKYRTTWLENFYKVHRDFVGTKSGPFAFVISAQQRDPLATYEMLDILKFGEVEIDQAKAPFTAGGRTYESGSWVVKMAQPYGGFAKTMLERQVYPDLRLFPGGPPRPPYDVTGHTLWMLLGVDVQQVEQPFTADLERVKLLAPLPSTLAARPKWAYAIGPESNAAFKALARLQKENVPVFRAATTAEAGGRTFVPGAWIVPPSNEATRVLADVVRETGLQVVGVDKPIAVDAFRVKPQTRIGLYRAANNMPGGWLKWLFEQYGFNHQLVSAKDFEGDLSAKYDTIVLPTGMTRANIVNGLDPKRHDREWEWAYGVGDAGWKKLADWVKGGGTLVAIGSAVQTAIELLDLPIEKALPEARRRRVQTEASARPTGDVDQAMRSTFQSPTSLLATLRDRVIEPENLFYCPGSLLQNEFDVANPIAYGMPAAWPVFFETDQAYRLKPGFGIPTAVAARYPATGPILQSGWLLGESFLRDQANVVMFKVGKGTVVTLGSQVDYRTQPRATLKLLFNAMFHGPSTEITAAQLARLVAAPAASH